MPLKYQSGEEIRKGDRILFHGEPGFVDLIADPSEKDPEAEWYIQEFGGGVGIVEERLGRSFIPNTEDAEDLIFLSRSESSNAIAKTNS